MDEEARFCMCACEQRGDKGDHGRIGIAGIPGLPGTPVSITETINIHPLCISYGDIKANST